MKEELSLLEEIEKGYRDIKLLGIILIVFFVLATLIQINILLQNPLIFIIRAVFMVTLLGMIINASKELSKAVKFGYIFLLLELIAVIVGMLVAFFKIGTLGITVIDIVLAFLLYFVLRKMKQNLKELLRKKSE